MTAEENDGNKRYMTKTTKSRAVGASSMAAQVEAMRLADRSTPRALISTIMGDMILPHGGTVALASLVRMGRALGLDDRLTRTTAVRLVYDGWFTTERIGRQSYYTVAGEQLDRLMRYAPRIYNAYGASWSGNWRFLMLVDSTAGAKDELAFHADLQWEGAGQLAPGLFVYPFDDVETLHRVLADHGMLDKMLLLSAPVRNAASGQLVSKLAMNTWDLETIEAEYEGFLQSFTPLLTGLKALPISPETAFVLRTMLILRYRKTALKDPQLPAEMLPAAWKGLAAQRLCSNLYAELLEPSETFLREIGRTPFGAFGPASQSLRDRFSGTA